MSSEVDYWSQRRKELLHQIEKDEAKLSEKLNKLYEAESAKLEREIAAYYQKYGVDNVIAYRRLLESLSYDDRRLLMERVEEFAQRYPQYAHLLPVRTSIYRLNELEGIQASIRMQQLEIGAMEQEELEKHFSKQAQRAANLAAERMGFGSSFYGIDAAVVVETVGAAWAKGKSFSDTIWANREKLAAYLNDDFAKMIARGVPYEQCQLELRKRFENVSRHDAMRLVYTEGTFLFNEAQARVDQEDFDFYALSCADSKACKICKDIQATQRETPARFADREPGINFPPLHPWCRCSYTVEVEDWEAWIDDYVASHGGDAVTPSLANQLIGAASDHEQAVTSLLRLMEGNGVELQGLEYRIKGQSSLNRKIKSDAVYMGVTQKSASSMIHDVLRYTYVMPEETFTDDFLRIQASLLEEGYNMVEVKNTLKQLNVSYRGVNTKVSTSDGYIFELQFHTEKSLEIKEKLNHPLYEKARLVNTSEEERAILTSEMVANSNTIPTPKRIEEVK